MSTNSVNTNSVRLGRTREFEADIDGVSLTEDPVGLAMALETIREPHGLLESLIFRKPRPSEPENLCSHPSTRDRIRALLALTGPEVRSLVLT